MTKASRLKAEQQFAASQKRDPQAMDEKEQVRQERAAQVARLRALRLGTADPADRPAKPTRSPLTDATQFPQARRG
ncbi:MAG: hypothetical protein H6907_06605 [Hyphomicrobiales bacterium]|nr:hypothetical protein [Hyphomicrobiales bacterium]